MTDLLVVIPTRERPERLARTVSAIVETRACDTRVLACVDEDDPRLGDYRALGRHGNALTLIVGPRCSLSEWTNVAARYALDGDVDPVGVPEYVASLGDDHVPETAGWDARCVTAIGALGGSLGGWAWGPDGFRKDLLPTWWVMSSTIVRRLGYMMLPTCEHMYVDNATQALAERAERACYLPDVMVRHEHPVAGYPEHADASYARSNRRQQYMRDHRAFEAWRYGPGLRDDLEKLRTE